MQGFALLQCYSIIITHHDVIRYTSTNSNDLGENMPQILTKPNSTPCFILMFMILPHGMADAITWNDTGDDDENSTGPRFVTLQFVQRNSFCIECLEKHSVNENMEREMTIAS